MKRIKSVQIEYMPPYLCDQVKMTLLDSGSWRMEVGEKGAIMGMDDVANIYNMMKAVDDINKQQ